MKTIIDDYYRRSTLAIDKALSKLPREASRSEIESAVDKAYPFKDMSKKPWSKWLEARRKLLRVSFPSTFLPPKKRKKKPTGQLELFCEIAPNNLSPAMRQYQQFKKQYPDFVLFFRMGDFYELFFEDAEMAAQVLGITLTKWRDGRDGGADIPMAGVPFHSVEAYLKKLIAAGHKAAICEQVENSAGKKIERRVVRRVAPSNAADAA